MGTEGLPDAPTGAVWRKASEITEGDLLHGSIRARVLAVDVKPKTVLLSLEAEDPEKVREMVGWAVRVQKNIRPRHDDYLAVVTEEA